MSAFEDLVRKGAYIDKTAGIAALIKTRSAVFVRPRKFGKSLLVQTLKELFLGRRDLFENTAIARDGYGFCAYPVIVFNMHFDVTTAADFAKSLKGMVKAEAFSRGISIRDGKPEDMFRELVSAIDAEIVVLVDNYDFVLADNLCNPEVAGIEAILSSFVEAMNDKQKFRFVFLTGINDFLLCRDNVGEVLGCEDRTHDLACASLCGFTAGEIAANFGNRLLDLTNPAYQRDHGIDVDSISHFSNSSISEAFADYLRQKEQNSEDLLDIIMKTLGGYRFAAKGPYVAAPGFVLKFLNENGIFSLNYDLRCARAYIVQNLRKKIFSIDDYIGQPMDPIMSCGPHHATRPEMGSLLLQNGLLTVDTVYEDEDELEWTLKIPNLEVRNFVERRLC